MTLNSCWHDQGDGLRPGDALELRPPPLDDDAHVEAQHEGHGDQVAEVGAVEGHFLEGSAARESRLEDVRSEVKFRSLIVEVEKLRSQRLCRCLYVDSVFMCKSEEILQKRTRMNA